MEKNINDAILDIIKKHVSRSCLEKINIYCNNQKPVINCAICLEHLNTYE